MNGDEEQDAKRARIDQQPGATADAMAVDPALPSAEQGAAAAEPAPAAADAAAALPPPPAEPEHVEASTLLPALQQLLLLYKAEYWALLEELRAKRHALCSEGRQLTADGAAATDTPAAAAAAAQAAAAASGGSMQDMLQAAAAAAVGPAQPAGAAVQAQAPAANGQAAEQQPGQAGAPAAAAGIGDRQAAAAAAPSLPPPLQQVEQLLLQLPADGDRGPPGPQQLADAHATFRAAAASIAGLEQLASAATMQYMDAQGGLACLCGQQGRWLVRRSAVSIGRQTDSKGDVDVDLSRAGPAASVSRLQAQLSLGMDGGWRLCNTGRAPLAVNGITVARGDSVALPHLSLLEVGGLPLLFMVNSMAVARALARSKHLVM